MSRTVLSTLLAVSLFLLAFCLTPVKPGLPMILKADEAAYYMMAQSLAEDFDLRLEVEDVDRAFREFPFRPIQNLVVMSSDGWRTVYYGKPLLVPLMAAPLTALFGANGFVLSNMMLLLGIAWMGFFYLRRFNPDAWSALFAFGFTFLSSGFSYVFWLQTEVFNMAAVAAACFLAFSIGGSGRRDGWLAALSGASLALVTFNKPMFALLGLALIWLAWRRSWRVGAAWLFGLMLALGGSAGLSWMMTGQMSAYIGSQQRTGVTVCKPGEMPIGPAATDSLLVELEEEFRDLDDLPADQVATGAGGGAVAAAAQSETGNTWSWLIRDPEISIRELWRNVLSFLVGRHTGFLLYLPFGGLAILLFVLEAPRESARWLLLASLTGVALYFLIFLPLNWQGGGGFIGNRYFIAAYPAFLFLVRRIQPHALVVAFYGIAGLFISPLFFSPMGNIEPEPTLQSHTRSAPYRWFPVELQLKHLPGYHRVRSGSLRTTARRDQVVPRGDEWWVRGSDRVEIFLETPRPLGPVRFRVASPAPANQITMDFGRAHETLDFDGAGQTLEVTLDPGPAEPVRVKRGQRSFVYRLLIEARDGAITPYSIEFPPDRCSYFAWNESTEVSFYQGVSVTLMGEQAESDRDYFKASLQSNRVPESVTAGETFFIRTTVSNDSDFEWPSRGAARAKLSYHWLNLDGEMVDRDGLRTELPGTVGAGQAVTLRQEIRAPRAAGEYWLEIEPVIEYLAWFSDRRPEVTLRRKVRVEGRE